MNDKQNDQYKYNYLSHYKYIYRDLKNGELTFLALVLFIAILSLSSITLFIESVRFGINQTASTLIGGDLVVRSTKSIPQEFIEKAKELNLKTALTVTFLSMLMFEEEFVLAEIKAVDANYPLKGELRINTESETQDELADELEDGLAKESIATQGPEEDSIWLDASLLSLLKAKIGDTIKLGNTSFKVTHMLTFEPGSGGEGITLAPRALMNINDVHKTGIIQPGSRYYYNLLLAGSPFAIDVFKNWVQPKLTKIDSLLTVENARQVVKTLLNQSEQYLHLILIINIVLAILALWQAAKQFSQKQIKRVALERTFGASFPRIIKKVLLEIAVIGFFFGILGYLVAIAIMLLVSREIGKHLFLQPLPIAWQLPLIFAIFMILFLLFFFIYPVFFKLRNISPMDILRGRMNGNGNGNGNENEEPIFATQGFTLQKNRISKRSLMPFLGQQFKKYGIKFVYYFKPNKFSVPLKFGISNLSHHFADNLIQVLAYTLILTSAWLLWMVKVDLIQHWQLQIPKDAPNYFVINIGPKEVNAFSDFLQKEAIHSQKIYPVIRGRLLAVNEEPVLMTEEFSVEKAEKNKEYKNTRQMRRLLNLTFDNQLPKENEIVAGHWFGGGDQKNLPEDKNEVSIEKDFSERLNIKLGDKLKFQIEESTVQVIVTSIRKVNWDSFSPNFYVIFEPKILEDFPFTYMTSFYLPSQKMSILKTMLQTFPGISLININNLIKQLLKTVDTLQLAVNYLWGLTAAITCILFLCSLAASLDERKRNAILFRVLGVGNTNLRIILLTEFIILGFVAGVISVVLAHLLYGWLAISVFKIPVTLNGWILLAGPGLAILFITSIGAFGIRKTFSEPLARMLSSRS